MSIREKFAIGALWSVIGNATVQLSTFVVFVILARLLDPVQFGIVAFASIFVDVTRQLLASGVPDALVRREQWGESYASSALVLNLTVSAVIGLLLFCVGALAFSVIGHGNSTPILMVLLISLPIDATRAIFEARLRRDFAFRAITFRNMVVNIISGGTAVTIALAGGGAWALVANKLVQNTLSLFITAHTAKWRPREPPEWSEVLDLARFSWSILVTQALVALNTEAAGLIIGIFLGPANLAIYRSGMRLTGLMAQLLISPLLSVALPAFSRISGNRRALALAYLRVVGMCSFVAMPAFFGAAAVAPTIVDIILGSQWHSAGAIMTVAGPAVCITVLEIFSIPIMTSIGKPRNAFVYYIACFGGNSILAVLTCGLGLVGVAASQTLRGYLTAPLLLYYLKREFDISAGSVANCLIPFLLSSLAMALVVYAVGEYTYAIMGQNARLALQIIVGVIVYSGTLLLIFRSVALEVAGEVASVLKMRR